MYIVRVYMLHEKYFCMDMYTVSYTSNDLELIFVVSRGFKLTRLHGSSNAIVTI